ncbi:MAG: hypothetical protein HY777_01760 [Betaproteobacteria bacterium]|nr:hypothetical protein [Betaproteobacteria bacterium]
MMSQDAPRDPTQVPTQKPAPPSPAAFSPEELARRRASSRRLAWLLGAVALGIYLVGLLFKR